MAIILDARSLCKAFGAVVAASEVSAAIEKDSVVGLIGTNGAGKTTFINIVTGYLKPARGSIAYEGRDITRLPPRDITRLGICRSFQIPQLYGSLSVFENMMIGIGIVLRNAGLAGCFSRRAALVPGYGEPAEAVAERILGRFGLLEYRERNAQVLPGGARKLLDIALAMVARPRLLLLDEPTSGVSAQEKFGIMQMVLDAVRAEGTTVLFVEHDMEVVSGFAQRVLAFYDGRIIADATPEVALADPEVRRHVVGRLKAAQAGATRLERGDQRGADPPRRIALRARSSHDRPDRPQWRRQDDAHEDGDGPPQAGRGRRAIRRPRSPRRADARARAPGHRLHA